MSGDFEGMDMSGVSHVMRCLRPDNAAASSFLAAVVSDACRSEHCLLV